MLRLFYTAAFALAFSQITSVHAAPRRCRVRTAWPGYEIGANPWGAVVAPSKSSTQASVSVNGCDISNAATGVTSVPPVETTTSSSNVFVPGTSSALTSILTSTITSTSTEASSSSSSLLSSTVEELSTLPSMFEAPTTTSVSPEVTSTPEPTTSSSPPPPPPTTSSTPEPSPSPSSSSEPPPPESTPNSSSASPDDGSSNNGSNGSNDVNEYLSAHNSVRSQHGASPLAWNNTLATAAQRWSDGCAFQHSGGAVGPFGENLAAGTGDYSITSAVTSWTNEVSEYNPNNPSASHFTQVVWKGSTQLGCAETTCAGGTIFSASSKYYVCEYFPQGNVIGAFAQNVQA